MNRGVGKFVNGQQHRRGGDAIGSDRVRMDEGERARYVGLYEGFKNTKSDTGFFVGRNAFCSIKLSFRRDFALDQTYGFVVAFFGLSVDDIL